MTHGPIARRRSHTFAQPRARPHPRRRAVLPTIAAARALQIRAAAQCFFHPGREQAIAEVRGKLTNAPPGDVAPEVEMNNEPGDVFPGHAYFAIAAAGDDRFRITIRVDHPRPARRCGNSIG